MVVRIPLLRFFFFNDTATTEIYTLSLHDALPICWVFRRAGRIVDVGDHHVHRVASGERGQHRGDEGGQVRRWHRPPGPDLHPHPAAADHDAGNFTAGQVRGDLSELASVHPGYARAPAHCGDDGIDVDTVDDRGLRHSRAWRRGHETREVVSWSSSVLGR